MNLVSKKVLQLDPIIFHYIDIYSDILESDIIRLYIMIRYDWMSVYNYFAILDNN